MTETQQDRDRLLRQGRVIDLYEEIDRILKEYENSDLLNKPRSEYSKYFVEGKMDGIRFVQELIRIMILK